jgi:hypothetical protein
MNERFSHRSDHTRALRRFMQRPTAGLKREPFCVSENHARAFVSLIRSLTLTSIPH